MAKIVFTAELSFDTDKTELTEKDAFQLLKDGMSLWPPIWAPHVTVDIKGGTIDGNAFKK